MDISQLAAKQKRYREWKEFLLNPSISHTTKESLEATVSQYGNLIVKIWEDGAQSPFLIAELEDIERQLEMLNESVRLQGTQTMGREFDK
jgi:hypothetical protein